MHDHGSQFLSAEWRAFVEGAGVTDVKTRVAHPQSNDRLERLHLQAHPPANPTAQGNRFDDRRLHVEAAWE